MSVLQRCPSYRGDRLVEVSVKRESTVQTIPAEKGTIESDSSELICKDVFK